MRNLNPNIEHIHRTYVLKDPTTNLIRWVGASSQKNINDRLSGHLSYNGSKIKNLWIKHLHEKGIRPILNVLKVYDTQEEMFDSEIQFIKAFSDIGHPLLNNSTGGKTSKGITHSEEQIKKQSVSMKKHYSDNPQALKNLTARLKSEKMRQCGSRRAIPILKMDFNNNIICKYKSQKEAQRDGYNQGLINACIYGRRNHHAGFKWVFEKDYVK